ncbi:MAG: hypothetical protein ACD_76C00094G0016 [uncultured bacterium]|nr:MAG: hypothetical protein ACD_76C00094G0016 [uncultured bacterium]HBD05271.1 50S ribosomal protein L29 [Candidatus Uhrbacteria bacterium]
MKFSDIKDKTREDLEQLLSEKRTALRELNWKIGANQVKDVREARDIKKLIAKILTRINQ